MKLSNTGRLQLERRERERSAPKIDSQDARRGSRCEPSAASTRRIREEGALIWARGSGPLGQRVLAPLPFAPDPNRRSSPDALGVARPLDPSSPLPSVRLGAARVGGRDILDPSNGAGRNEFSGSLMNLLRTGRIADRCALFPRSETHQDSTFPRGKCRRAAAAHFPPALRVSGTLRGRLGFASLFFIRRIRVRSINP
jgi:hypothetical protein